METGYRVSDRLLLLEKCGRELEESHWPGGGGSSGDYFKIVKDDYFGR